ncbi:MAG: toxin-antitoxin system [Pseudomonadota bacterium]
MSDSTVGLRLSADVRERLKALGEIRDRSPHYLMRVAIERYLQTEEALEDEKQLLRERWRRYELTDEAVPHSEVREWARGLREPTGFHEDP